MCQEGLSATSSGQVTRFVTIHHSPAKQFHCTHVCMYVCVYVRTYVRTYVRMVNNVLIVQFTMSQLFIVRRLELQIWKNIGTLIFCLKKANSVVYVYKKVSFHKMHVVLKIIINYSYGSDQHMST